MNFTTMANTKQTAKPKRKKYINPDNIQVNPRNFKMEDGKLTYIGRDKTVKIPNKIEGQTVKVIKKRAFANTSVEVVILPETIEEIEDEAFDDCINLNQINFPDSIKRIGRWAFQGCHSLSEVHLPSQLEEIDGYAFDECFNLEKITMPSEVKRIGAYAFSETKLKKVILPHGIKYLGNSLFYNCRHLSHVVFQEGLAEIGQSTFNGCSRLKAVCFPRSLERINLGAFAGCVNLGMVIIHQKIEAIAQDAFGGCRRIKDVYSTFESEMEIEILSNESNLFRTFGISEGIDTEIKYDSVGALVAGYSADFNKVTWLTMGENELNQFSARFNGNIYRSLGIPYKNFEEEQKEKRRDTETFHVDGLSKVVEEEITEKDLYVETLSKGYQLKTQGNLQGACDKYLEAINFKPMITTGYYNLGKILYLLNDYDSSIRAYQTAIHLGHDKHETLRHIGHAILDETMKRGAYKGAVMQYVDNIYPFAQIQRMLKGKSIESVPQVLMSEYDQICMSVAEKFLQHASEERL